MHFFGHLRSCCLACADRPNGLVGDNESISSFGGDTDESTFKLCFNHFVDLTGFTLVECLANANDRLEVRVKSSKGLLIDDGVGLAEVFTALRVPKDDEVCE